MGMGSELIIAGSDTMIAECVHVLSSRRLYNKSREEIRLALSPLVSLDSFKIANRRALLRALDLYATYLIDFDDTFLKAIMKRKISMHFTLMIETLTTFLISPAKSQRATNSRLHKQTSLRRKI
jgi:predicted nucleic-acid-binding protein